MCLCAFHPLPFFPVSYFLYPEKNLPAGFFLLLFIFGCVGSSLLCVLSLVVVNGGW